MGTERIPLFPLEVVLFPGTPLPLHIFEPRYKLMVRLCLEKRVAFGVILSRAGGIASVGCTAEIIKLIKKYEDGRMDILTMGLSTYRVLEVFKDQPYLEAAVEYVEDEPAPCRAGMQEKLWQLLKQCHVLVYGRAPKSREASAGPSITFHIASELPLGLEYKQELLELRSESKRQARLHERLKQWLPELAHLERARGKAAGNGHGLRQAPLSDSLQRGGSDPTKLGFIYNGRGTRGVENE